MKFPFLLLFLFASFFAFALPKPQTPATAIASLTDPTKLATLKGERAANPRLNKAVYWLAKAESNGQKPEDVLAESARINGTAGTPYAGFVQWGLLQNLQ